MNNLIITSQFIGSSKHNMHHYIILVLIMLDDDVDHTFSGEPQEEGMMQQSSSFP